MLLALDDFIFSLPTLAYQELSRRSSWRWSQNPRIGARAASQFLGPGEDTISLAGDLVPQIVGDVSSIDQLRALGDRGEALALVSGDGRVHGAYVILSLDERQGLLWSDGSARRYDFSIELRAVDDEDALDPGAKPSAEAIDQEMAVQDDEEIAAAGGTGLTSGASLV